MGSRKKSHYYVLIGSVKVERYLIEHRLIGCAVSDASCCEIIDKRSRQRREAKKFN